MEVNFTKIIGPTIAIISLSVGIIGTWATNNSDISSLQEDVAAIIKKIDRFESTVHDLEVNAVRESSITKSMKEDVTEIKADVKKLLQDR